MLEKLSRREKYEEENDFYICKDCQLLFTFPQAMNCDFNCPDCEKPLGHFDNEAAPQSLKIASTRSRNRWVMPDHQRKIV